MSDIRLIHFADIHLEFPYPHAISFAAKMIRSLRNDDIPVVIIDGNHETASVLLMGSPTVFLTEFFTRGSRTLET